MQGPLCRTWGPEVERLTISPLSDIHIGSPQFVYAAFTKWRDAVLADEHHFVVLNGDYGDTIVRSSVGDIWEQRMTPMEQLTRLTAELQPLATAGRILAVTTGNHDERTKKETSLDMAMLLADRLGVADLYQTDGAIVILRFGRSDTSGKDHNGRTKPQVYTIYATHGRTGGRLPGAKIIAAARLGDFANSDVVFMGHVHDEMARMVRRLDIDANNRKVRWRDQAQVVAGSFLDFGGYAQRFGYQPGAIGMPRVILDGRHHGIEVVM